VPDLIPITILKYIPLYFDEDEENIYGAARKKQLILADGYITAQTFGDFYYNQVHTFQLPVPFSTQFHAYFSYAIQHRTFVLSTPIISHDCAGNYLG
jgi:hypothetical protein